MTPLVAAVIGFLGIALTGLVTFLVASRKSSGLIKTSEATDLWEAAEQIRHELRAEVVILRERSASAETREEQCEARLRVIAEDLSKARERISVLEAKA